MRRALLFLSLPSGKQKGPDGRWKGRWKKPLGQGQGRTAGLSAPQAGQVLARRGATALCLSRSRLSGAGKRNQAGPGRRRGARAGPRGGADGLSPPPAPGPAASPARSQPLCVSRWPHRRTMKWVLLAVLAAVLCVERGKRSGGGGCYAAATACRRVPPVPPRPWVWEQIICGGNGGVRVPRRAGWALEVGGLQGSVRIARGLGGTELRRAGVWCGVCVWGGCLSKTCLAAMSLLKQELQGFCAWRCRCASPAVHVDILELFPVSARTKTRAGRAPALRCSKPG